MNRSILDEVHFSPEKGAFYYKDVRYLLIRPETLAAFQKAIEKELGPKSSRILFQSGFQGGSLSSKKYRETFQISDREVVEFMVEMGSQIGWGRFELDDFDPAQKRLIVRVSHSPFAEAYGPSPVPVCHLIRGVLSGTGSVVFGKEVEGKESACVAKGDSFCRFEIM